jgi:hypothetical protein
MRRLRLILATILLMSTSGCAMVGEAVFDCIWDGTWDALFGSSADRVDDDEAYMLRRKGIEPGSEQHRTMIADEERFQEFHRDGN